MSEPQAVSEEVTIPDSSDGGDVVEPTPAMDASSSSVISEQPASQMSSTDSISDTRLTTDTKRLLTENEQKDVDTNLSESDHESTNESFERISEESMIDEEQQDHLSERSNNSKDVNDLAQNPERNQIDSATDKAFSYHGPYSENSQQSDIPLNIAITPTSDEGGQSCCACSRVTRLKLTVCFVVLFVIALVTVVSRNCLYPTCKDNIGGVFVCVVGSIVLGALVIILSLHIYYVRTRLNGLPIL